MLQADRHNQTRASLESSGSNHATSSHVHMQDRLVPRDQHAGGMGIEFLVTSADDVPRQRDGNSSAQAQDAQQLMVRLMTS